MDLSTKAFGRSMNWLLLVAVAFAALSAASVQCESTGGAAAAASASTDGALIQSLLAKIETLEARIEALESPDRLEGRVRRALQVIDFSAIYNRLAALEAKAVPYTVEQGSKYATTAAINADRLCLKNACFVSSGDLLWIHHKSTDKRAMELALANPGGGRNVVVFHSDGVGSDCFYYAAGPGAANKAGMWTMTPSGRATGKLAAAQFCGPSDKNCLSPP